MNPKPRKKIFLQHETLCTETIFKTVTLTWHYVYLQAHSYIENELREHDSVTQIIRRYLAIEKEQFCALETMYTAHQDISCK